jgi:hypothetical protein
MSSDLIRGWIPVRVKKTRQNEETQAEQDEIGLGGDDGPSLPRTQAAGVLRAEAPFYFAWGCFRDFVSGPCGVPPKSICTASGTRVIG